MTQIYGQVDILTQGSNPNIDEDQDNYVVRQGEKRKLENDKEKGGRNRVIGRGRERGMAELARVHARRLH